MNNKTQPTAEQLAAWRAEWRSAFPQWADENPGSILAVASWQSYLCAKQNEPRQRVSQMSNKTQPTPGQLTKWREEAMTLWRIEPTKLGDTRQVSFIAGFLRANQESLQAMKLMEKAANISAQHAQHARKQALEEAINQLSCVSGASDYRRFADKIKELLA